MQKSKEEIVNADAALVSVREDLKHSRAAYDVAAAQRKEASQSINRMLHRKPSWTSPEVLGSLAVGCFGLFYFFPGIYLFKKYETIFLLRHKQYLPYSMFINKYLYSVEFTELCQEEHRLERDETDAKTALTEAELQLVSKSYIFGAFRVM